VTELRSILFPVERRPWARARTLLDTPHLRPNLIVVTGRPGAGKSTLAHALAREVACPAICRDEIKEGLINTTRQFGTPNSLVGRHVLETFFDTIELLLRRNVTLVAEAGFQHHLWAPALEKLTGIACIRVVLCLVDPLLARKRHVARGIADPRRIRFHDEQLVHAARMGIDLPIDDYEPIAISVPMLTVDTSDGYEPTLPEIATFACSVHD
jgi:predicted kinase